VASLVLATGVIATLAGFSFLVAAALAIGVSIATVALGAVVVDHFIDPAPAAYYQFVGQPGSPELSSLVLPIVPGISTVEVSELDGGQWLSPELIDPAQRLYFASGVTGFELQGLDNSGDLVPFPDGFLFDLTFASVGEFTGTLEEIPTAAVPEPSCLLLFCAGLVFVAGIRVTARIR